MHQVLTTTTSPGEALLDPTSTIDQIQALVSIVTTTPVVLPANMTAIILTKN